MIGLLSIFILRAESPESRRYNNVYSRQARITRFIFFSNAMFFIKYLFYFLIFSLPFGTRKFIYQFTDGFNENTAAFLYAHDFLITTVIILCAALWFREIKNKKPKIKSTNQKSKILLIIFLFFSAISIFFAYSKGLAVYSFLRLLMAAGFSLAVSWAIKNEIINLRGIFWSLGLSALLQSLIAFLQFAYQKSLGLWFLGEPNVELNGQGVAKIVVAGGRLIRAYGTMPHSNILAAFLVLGLLSLLHVWLRNTEKVRIYEKIILVSSIFVIVVGLILTFSRSGWITAVLSVVAMIVVLLIQKSKIQPFKRPVMGLMLVLLLAALFNFFVFKDFILARGYISKTDPSFVLRVAYNKIALDLIGQKPLGVGIGNQVLYSVRNGEYQKFGLDHPWLWEPIHNLYLLATSEIGVLGTLTLIMFLLSLLISNFKFLISKQFQISNGPSANQGVILNGAQRNEESLKSAIVTVMLLALLMLGLFDHYLWTLEPGRLMLWLVIGMALPLDDV